MTLNSKTWFLNFGAFVTLVVSGAFSTPYLFDAFFVGLSEAAL